MSRYFSLRIFFASLAFKIAILSLSLLEAYPSQQFNYCQWDCRHFLDIAQFGYSLEKNHLFAFFPAVPLIFKALMSTGFLSGTSLWIAVSILNLLLSALAYTFLYSWVAEIRKDWAPIVWGFVLVDRFTLWSFLPYTEPLFFASLCIALRISRGDQIKNKYFAAAIGGLASGVRVVGAVIGTGIALQNLKSSMTFKNFLHSLVIGLSGAWALLLYMMWMESTYSDPFLFIKAQAHWARHSSLNNILPSIWFLIKTFHWPTLPLLILGILALCAKSSHLNMSERFIFLLMIIIPLSTGPVAMNRFLSLIPVGYIVLAGWFKSKWPEFAPNTQRVWKTLLVIHLISESYWQVRLAARFFRGENFPWIG